MQPATEGNAADAAEQKKPLLEGVQDSTVGAPDSNQLTEGAAQRKKSNFRESFQRFSQTYDASADIDAVGSDAGMRSSELVFENPRFSTRFSRPSLLESIHRPSQSSIDFYARQSQVATAGRRRSQLADELGKKEVTHRLLSAKFSASIASEVQASSAKAGTRMSGAPTRSLLYPEVGQLDLRPFLEHSDDSDELTEYGAKLKSRPK